MRSRARPARMIPITKEPATARQTLTMRERSSFRCSASVISSKTSGSSGGGTARARPTDRTGRITVRGPAPALATTAGRNDFCGGASVLDIGRVAPGNGVGTRHRTVPQLLAPVVVRSLDAVLELLDAFAHR